MCCCERWLASGPRTLAPYDDRVRLIWILVFLLLAAGAAALAWPRTGDAQRAASQPALNGAAAQSANYEIVEVPVPTQTPAFTPSAAELDKPVAPIAPPANLTNIPVIASEVPEVSKLTAGPPAVIERIDERTIRLDGKYIVRGNGSQDDPYRITWDLLSSARATIDAGKNQFELPGRLASLQDAWVEISAYWAPPLQRFESKEIMAMMNKWDGCCLGLPPTPFDSIDVQLTAPASIVGQHLFRFGTLRGRLHIEPFAAGPFLLGLYRLDSATLESS